MLSYCLLCGVLLLQLPLACLWDYDTLAVERSEFPGVHEMIVGHFARHSPAYYKWRIENRSAISVEQRTPADYDDIAVAHEKIGDHDTAIDIMEEKIQRWPDADRYQSEANLATFLIHAGRLQDGLEHIDLALEINPDAHFGRETYQRMLVQALLAKDDPKQLPVWSKDERGAGDFFRNQNGDIWDQDSKKSAQSAMEGVLGMLRFGNHDSPVLLEALGDLLSNSNGFGGGDPEDAKQLAARAYLVASYQCDEPARSLYRDKAGDALSMQVGYDIDRVEAELREELVSATALQEQVAAD